LDDSVLGVGVVAVTWPLLILGNRR